MLSILTIILSLPKVIQKISIYKNTCKEINNTIGAQ
jgi:hypothetical protein